MNQTVDKSNDQCCSKIDASIRENPTRALLIAAGVGLAIAVTLRAMQPEPPLGRGAAMLKDIQARLHKLSDRASDLASSGSSMVQEGLEHVRSQRASHGLSEIGKWFRNFFR